MTRALAHCDPSYGPAFHLEGNVGMGSLRDFVSTAPRRRALGEVDAPRIGYGTYGPQRVTPGTLTRRDPRYGGLTRLGDEPSWWDKLKGFVTAAVPGGPAVAAALPSVVSTAAQAIEGGAVGWSEGASSTAPGAVAPAAKSAGLPWGTLALVGGGLALAWLALGRSGRRHNPHPRGRFKRRRGIKSYLKRIERSKRRHREVYGWSRTGHSGLVPKRKRS